MTYISRSSFLCSIFLVSFFVFLVGCESGNSSQLDQEVRLADLEVESIEVTPAGATLESGLSFQFSAMGVQKDGGKVDLTNDVTWSSSNNAIVSVSKNGLVTAITGQDGSVSITASLASLTGSTTLDASTAPITGINVYAVTDTPDTLAILPCRNLQLMALGEYNEGGGTVERSEIPLTSLITWTANNQAIIGANTGLLRSRNEQGIQVTVTHPDLSDTADVSIITGDLSMIAVTPVAQKIDPDESLQYTATGTYLEGEVDITDNVFWTSSVIAAAEFKSPNADPGEITGIADGSTTVTATCGSISAATSLVVQDSGLQDLEFEVSGSEVIEVDVIVGGGAEFIELFAVYEDGDRINVTDLADWNVRSGSESIISINVDADNDRVDVTGLSAGVGFIDVSYEGIDKAININVSN